MSQLAPLCTNGGDDGTGARAGLILRFGGTLRFIPLSSVLLVALEPPITRVPGTPFGIALVGEYVTAVLHLGPTTGQLVLCEIGGEPISLSGTEVLESGNYATVLGGVRYADATVPVMDVTEQLGQLRAGLGKPLGRQENPE